MGINKTLSQLSPNPKNPRKITDEKLKMLKASLDEFGSLDGFIFNRKTQRLAGGHQRLKVMPKNAEIRISESFKEPTKTGTVAFGFVILDGERHPYREVEWDETTEKAANIAANKGAGVWDMPQLSEWFSELDTSGFELDLTMFDAEERAELLEKSEETNEGLCDPDETPESPEETKVRLGDLFELGGHRLLCGDSTKREDVETLMAGEKADMVFTDPPYGMSVVKADGNIGGVRKGSIVGASKMHRAKVGVYRPVIGDDKPFDPTFLLGLSDLQIIWGANHFSDKLPTSPHWIVWNKEMPEGTDFSGAELAWTNIDKKAVKVYKFVWAGMTRQGDRNEELSKRVHPTQKPVGLFTQILNDYGPESVIDLFLGSGTTLIACEKTNRRCFGMEIDPHYCSVILDRWAKFTGKDPVREDGIRWSELKKGD